MQAPRMMSITTAKGLFEPKGHNVICWSYVLEGRWYVFLCKMGFWIYRQVGRLSLGVK